MFRIFLATCTGLYVFWGSLKTAVYIIGGAHVLHRQFGFPYREGFFTEMDREGAIGVSKESHHPVGQLIAYAADFFEELQPYVGKVFALTESEAMQLRALVEVLAPLMDAGTQEHAERVAHAIAMFLWRVPKPRIRKIRQK